MNTGHFPERAFLAAPTVSGDAVTLSGRTGGSVLLMLGSVVRRSSKWRDGWGGTGWVSSGGDKPGALLIQRHKYFVWCSCSAGECLQLFQLLSSTPDANRNTPTPSGCGDTSGSIGPERWRHANQALLVWAVTPVTPPRAFVAGEAAGANLRQRRGAGSPGWRNRRQGQPLFGEVR